MHVSNFQADLQKGKIGEKIALDVLQGTTENYAFEDVSDLKEYHHKGDIMVLRDGELECFIDVKDDGVLHKSRNILCEDKVYYRKQKQMKDGFMHYDYNYLAIVSQPEKKIYIIDMKKLKKHYKEGLKRELHYSWQYSICYFVPLEKAYKYNMVVAEIDYDEDNSCCYPLSVNKYYSYLH